MWWAIAIGAGLAILLGGTGVAVAASAERSGADGICRADPAGIARAHGVSLDVEALARLGVSEMGASARGQTAVMWAAINAARGKSVSALLLRGRLKNGMPSSSDGKFGAQNTGKYASTRLPSTAASRELAARVLAGKVPDPTGGATRFDAPTAQDKLRAAGVAGYSQSAAEIAAARSAKAVLVMVPGITSTRFWRPIA